MLDARVDRLGTEALRYSAVERNGVLERASQDLIHGMFMYVCACVPVCVYAWCLCAGMNSGYGCVRVRMCVYFLLTSACVHAQLLVAYGNQNLFFGLTHVP